MVQFLLGDSSTNQIKGVHESQDAYNTTWFCNMNQQKSCIEIMGPKWLELIRNSLFNVKAYTRQSKYKLLITTGYNITLKNSIIKFCRWRSEQKWENTFHETVLPVTSFSVPTWAPSHGGAQCHGKGLYDTSDQEMHLPRQICSEIKSSRQQCVASKQKPLTTSCKVPHIFLRSSCFSASSLLSFITCC